MSQISQSLGRAAASLEDCREQSLPARAQLTLRAPDTPRQRQSPVMPSRLVPVAALMTAACVLAMPARAADDDADCVRKHSMAWCVMQAGKLAKGIADVSGKDAAAAQKAAGPGWYIGAGAGTATRFWKPAPGFSRGGEIGMLVLSWLFQPSNLPPISGFNVIVAWMPTELAASALEANRVAQGILMDAIRKTFDGSTLTLVTGEYEARSREYADRIDRVGYRIEGGKCAEHVCTLWQIKAGHNSLGIADTRSEPGKAPWFLGGYEAWVFEGTRGRITMWQLEIDGRWVTHQMAREFSANLPQWMYVITSPEYQAGKLKFNEGSALPLVHHQGKTLLPVFPELPADGDADPAPPR